MSKPIKTNEQVEIKSIPGIKFRVGSISHRALILRPISPAGKAILRVPPEMKSLRPAAGLPKYLRHASEAYCKDHHMSIDRLAARAIQWFLAFEEVKDMQKTVYANLLKEVNVEAAHAHDPGSDHSSATRGRDSVTDRQVRFKTGDENTDDYGLSYELP